MSKQTKQIRSLISATRTGPSVNALLSVSAVLLLSACTTTPKPNPAVQYQCERGTQLSVVFNHTYVSVVRGGRNGMHRMEKRTTGASVTLADGTALELPAQKVSSGFMISNGQYTFRGQGDSATWAVGRMAPESCSVEAI